MKSKFGKQKNEVLGPSLTCAAMILLIVGRPVDSVFLWAALIVAVISLVLVNLSYTAAYNRNKSEVEKD